MKRRQKRLILFIFALVFLISACGGGEEKTPTPTGTYPVDRVFLPFYNQVGGAKVLGPAISPIFVDRNKIYQYTVAGLLLYDPDAPAGQRVRLAPLGEEGEVREIPADHPPDAAGRFVDGYQIFDKFVPLFDRMGGESVTGKPLTEAHMNFSKGRYEQYFENVGFYWLEGAADDAVHLLAFGDWKCRDACPNTYAENAAPELPHVSAPPFVSTADELGLDFTGFPHTAPYLGDESHLNQVYENLVMVADLVYLENVQLKPLPEAVGISKEAPKGPDPMPGMDFIRTDEDLGYNVPRQFVEYIMDHRGFGFVGMPITHVSRPDEQIMEQCFTNLCLRSHPDEDGNITVAPIPLGLEYRLNQACTGLEDSLDVTIQVWERDPLVGPDQEQEIGVIVMGSGKPVPNVCAELSLELPGNEQQVHQMPPTDQNGEANLLVGPIEAENSTIIPYQVCVNTQNLQKFCVGDSFVIWQMLGPKESPTPPPFKTSYLPFVFKNISLYLPAFLDQYITFMPFIGNQR